MWGLHSKGLEKNPREGVISADDTLINNAVIMSAGFLSVSHYLTKLVFAKMLKMLILKAYR